MGRQWLGWSQHRGFKDFITEHSPKSWVQDSKVCRVLGPDVAEVQISLRSDRLNSKGRWNGALMAWQGL